MEALGENVNTIEKSEVLTETEVNNIVEGKETPAEAVLPSDTEAFDVPEKFKGKSLEDVIKSYQELEKMKAQPKEETEEGGGPESKEGEEPSNKEATIEQETYNKYQQSFIDNGELSEVEYSELAELGFSKEQVDAEIAQYRELQEYQTYKQEKTLNEVLAPLGGGTEKFKQVAEWANTNKSPEEVAEFNAELARAGKLAQQALLKSLYSEYESDVSNVDTVLHTNTPQTSTSRGYKTQEEFFKDIGSEEYKNNAAYRAAVEKKMSMSNIF